MEWFTLDAEQSFFDADLITPPSASHPNNEFDSNEEHKARDTTPTSSSEEREGAVSGGIGTSDDDGN
jgi:hypothetical protein